MHRWEEVWLLYLLYFQEDDVFHQLEPETVAMEILLCHDSDQVRDSYGCDIRTLVS